MALDAEVADLSGRFLLGQLVHGVKNRVGNCISVHRAAPLFVVLGVAAFTGFGRLEIALFPFRRCFGGWSLGGRILGLQLAGGGEQEDCQHEDGGGGFHGSAPGGSRVVVKGRPEAGLGIGEAIADGELQEPGVAEGGRSRLKIRPGDEIR